MDYIIKVYMIKYSEYSIKLKPFEDGICYIKIDELENGECFREAVAKTKEIWNTSGKYHELGIEVLNQEEYYKDLKKRILNNEKNLPHYNVEDLKIYLDDKLSSYQLLGK